MGTVSYSITETLKTSYPFWDHLSLGQKNQLVSCSHIRAYLPGSFIRSRSGECPGVTLMLSGQARTYIQSEEGHEIILLRLDTEDVCIFSTACMMQEITFDIFTEAAGESTLLIITAACIHRPMEDNAYTEGYIYRRVAERFSDVMWSTDQLLFSSFGKRLATYLVGEQVKSRTNTISTTHEQVAKNLDATREMISRMLKYFEEEGIVSLGGGTITVVDTRKLRKLLA